MGENIALVKNNLRLRRELLFGLQHEDPAPASHSTSAAIAVFDCSPPLCTRARSLIMVRRTLLLLLGCLLMEKASAAGCWGNGSSPTIARLNPHLLQVGDVEMSARRIVNGPLYQMGDFRGCLFHFEEKYCLTTVQLNKADDSSELWRRIEESNQVRTNFRRDKLTIGICVPLECTHENVREGLQESLVGAALELGVSVTVSVDEKNCQTDTSLPFTAGDYIVGFVIVSIFLLVLIGSSYDALKRLHDSNKPPQLTGARFLICFSFLKNWERLVRINNSEESRSFHSIQGMRALTMYLVITAHTVFWAIRGPVQNPDWVEKSYSDIFRSSFMNGNAIMGTFLSISGLLLGFMFMKDVAAKGTFVTSDFFRLVVHRYIRQELAFYLYSISFAFLCLILVTRYFRRLTPVYAVMLALSSSWFDHFGRGPMWPQIVSQEVEECKQSWWWHLLYLNNYIGASKTCMAHTWYLAVDFQCFLASVPVLIVASKLPKYRTTILHLEHDQTFIRTYVPFHTNCGAYFVGVISGVVCYHAKINGVKKTKAKIFLVWAIGLALPSMFLILSFIFFQPSYRYEVLSASLYAAIYKMLFAMGISVLVVGCALGLGWIGNAILSWRPFQVLGRLSYNAYLIHFCVQRMQAGAVKDPVHLDEYALARSSTADVVVSACLALILCLCVEMPSSAIPKIFGPQNTSPDYKNSTNKDSQLQSGAECTSSSLLHEKLNALGYTTSERL
ncbi:hypothetical protein C0J52_00736 [Blattella germanica]|nr:hypothetical protein C0J52_00736 [Blattella germanica]